MPYQPLVEHFAFGAVCEHLQAVSDRQIKNLIINVPPGMAKSTLTAVLWPIWDWVRNPTLRWMFATYSLDLTYRDARHRRRLMLERWYRDRFGARFDLVDEGVELVTNSRQGYMFSGATGGQSTGWRAHRLVLDDPQDPKGAESELKRASTIEFLTKTWPTRIDAMSEHAGKVLIQQRLHENDATGLYLKLGGQEEWTHLKIPLHYTGKTVSTPFFRDPRTKVGESISEVIYPAEATEALKKKLGPYGTAGQLQQEPAPAEGGIVKTAWIRHYEGGVPSMDSWIDLPGFCRFRPMEHFRFCTIDPATSDKELTKGGKLNDPDYFVIGSWCLVGSTRGAVLVCLDMVIDRIAGPDQEPRIKAMHDVWKFALIAVESVGFQLSLFQRLLRMGLPVRELSKAEDAVYRIDGDKTARAYAATPLMADGRFFVPTYAPWLGEMVLQITCYPNAAHDDALDCATYAVALAEKIGPQLGQVVDADDETPQSSRYAHSDAGINDPNKDDYREDDDPFSPIRLAPP